MTTYAPIGLVALMIVMTMAGWLVQSRLAEHHRSRDTMEAVRLVLGMLITFTALVLSLLTNTSKTYFDQAETALGAYSVDLISLDEQLRAYGTEADPSRRLLRTYVAAALADTWPEEPLPSGEYPHIHDPIVPGSAESLTLGDMLLTVERELNALVPGNAQQARWLAVVQAGMTETLRERWHLVGVARPITSWPFMAIMTVWLSLVFVMFGLSSPRNRLVVASVMFAALSVALVMALIVELEGPLDGWLKISSQPLRDALAHIDRPAKQP